MRNARSWKATAVAAALLTAAAAGQGTAADAAAPRAQVTTFTKVSGSSPFAQTPGCSGEGAITDAEVEPHLSVHPRNPQRLLAIWQQDRHTNGGARTTMVADSTNGGRSWTRHALPKVSKCTGGDQHKASDPWSAIGANGMMYAASMAVSDEEEFDGDSVLHRSSGSDWEGPLTIAADDGIHWHEKQIIAAHPGDSERLYAAWGQHLMPDPAPLAATADVNIGFSRSTDGGLTWSDPVVAPPDLPAVNEWPVPGGILPLDTRDPDRLLLIGDAIPSRLPEVPGCVLYSTATTDGGRTWGDISVIATGVQEPPAGDYERLIGVRSYWGCILSSAAVAPDGTAYVAWFERTPRPQRANGTEIRLSRSMDSGATWETVVVAEVPQLGFLPTVAVKPDGTVGVSYFDTRHDVLGDEEMTTNLWLSWSDDQGDSWDELRLTETSFDLRTAPRTPWYMLGDYVGLVGLPTGFGALVALSQPIAETGPTDIFYIHAAL